MKSSIEAFECDLVLADLSKKKLKDLNNAYEDNSAKYLGIHQEFENYELNLKSHFYVGYRWLERKTNRFIHIKPKTLLKNKEIDYVKMLLFCLEDPIVSKSMKDTYEIFFKEKWIEIEDKKDEISSFIVLQFLKLLDRIKIKGLKKGYKKETHNLTSKIKGKILINETIKNNHIKNKLNKTVCTHEVFTEDCIENQILKTALLQCNRYIGNKAEDEVLKLLKRNLNFFRHIDSKKVFDSDFKKIKHSAFYKEYKEALRLAKIIFKRFGFSLDESVQNRKRKTPPFYINMEQLFKKYVEVKLRQRYNKELITNHKVLKGKLKPDFLVKDKKIIINTQYSLCPNSQSLGYRDFAIMARDKKIKKFLGIKDDSEIDIICIYPSIKDLDQSFKDISIGNYTNIHKLELSIPLKDV